MALLANIASRTTLPLRQLRSTRLVLQPVLADLTPLARLAL